MKRIVKQVVFFVILAGLFCSCGSGGNNALLGVWNGKVSGIDVELAFFNDLGFLNIDGDVEASKYDYLAKEGILVTDLGNIPVSLNNNSLTVNFEGMTVVLVKDTKSKVAPNAIHGVWKGPRGWVLAFCNNKVYLIDDDGDADYGNFRFDRNNGSFRSRNYSYEIDFSVSGNTLTTSDDLEAVFTRAK